MNDFLLDTNVPSEIKRTRPNPMVDSWLGSQVDRSLYLSVLTIGEIRRGIVLLPDSKRRRTLQRWLDDDIIPAFEGRILPVSRAIAETWAVLSVRRQRAGRPLKTVDGLIAATALEHKLTLVTRNVSDFADLGLHVLNPWLPQ